MANSPTGRRTNKHIDMKTYTQELGKVRITCEGKYDSSKDYDLLCLVYDDYKASYISRKAVPAGTPLSNKEYWQPFSTLNEAIVLDYEEFQADVLKRFVNLQIALSKARLVVEDDDERLTLTIDQVAPGCEVYVIKTGLTWILDTIETGSNNKTWHLESEGKVDSVAVEDSFESIEPLTVDRAVADANGDQIDNTYVKISAVTNYVVAAAEEALKKLKVVLPVGSINYEDLSKELQQALVSGHVTITNAADGQDIGVNEDNLLQLKDRDNTYGMGYIRLRKHFIGDLNVLEQEMINQPNTIYEVRYDYSLDQEVITLPENSIIYFVGGSFSNGTINQNDAVFDAIGGYDAAKHMKNVTINNQ